VASSGSDSTNTSSRKDHRGNGDIESLPFVRTPRITGTGESD
jgi:hypothetical protein